MRVADANPNISKDNYMDRTAIVTGAAGDIGRAITQRLVDDGYHVNGWDIDSKGLAENVDLYGDQKYTSTQVDLLDMAQVKEAAKTSIISEYPVSLLVNNAGAARSSASLANSKEQDIVFELDINFTSAWRCIDQLQHALIQTGCASIVNIASINGIGVYGMPGYSAAKAALINLTKFAAVELGKKGVRVNAISAGTVRTKAWEPRVKNDPHIFEKVSKWYPLKKVSEPEDVAAAVSFLASQDARMITGVSLPVDGGLSAGIDTVASDICQSEI
jgi:NAD(P)-dependent dehydrogenase (short-subunit alcohol dehydrogenase family)